MLLTLFLYIFVHIINWMSVSFSNKAKDNIEKTTVINKGIQSYNSPTFNKIWSNLFCANPSLICIIKTHLSGRMQRYMHYILETHCRECHVPNNQTQPLGKQNFQYWGPLNKNNDRMRMFLVASWKEKKTIKFCFMTTTII